MRTIYTYFFLLSLSYCKYITSQFFKNVNSFQMPMFMDTPPKKVNLEIDMAIDYTWTTPFLYPDQSLTKQLLPNEDRLNFSNRRTVQPDRIEDKASIMNLGSNDNVTTNFLFYYMKYKLSLDYEAIGLAYKFHDKSLSLIHNLYTSE